LGVIYLWEFDQPLDDVRNISDYKHSKGVYFPSHPAFVQRDGNLHQIRRWKEMYRRYCGNHDPFWYKGFGGRPPNPSPNPSPKKKVRKECSEISYTMQTNQV